MRLIFILLASLGSLFSFQASAYDRLVVYGDSLSAIRNCRASNGKLWHEYLLPRLGLTEAQLTVPAECGARSDQLEGQLAQYPGGGPADPNALYVILIGGNDYIQALSRGPVDAGALVGGVVDRIGAAVERLHASGARAIVVAQLPDLGRVPIGARSPVAGLASQVVAEHNRRLLARLGEAASRLGITIMTLDSWGLYDAVLRQPQAFGFTETQRYCSELPSCDADRTVFYDSLHPTTAMHRVIAAAFAKALNLPAGPQ